MRIRRAVVGLASLAVLASCGPSYGGSALSRGPIRRGPVILRAEPLCTYRVLGQIGGRESLGTTVYSGRNPVTAQARALGADAVIGYNAVPEFDNSHRIVATRWNAIAIDFSDPSDPNCYR